MAAFDSKLGKADTRGIQPVITRAPADTSGERDQMIAKAIGVGAKAAGSAYAKSQAAGLAGADISLAEANQQADVVDTKIEEALKAETELGPVNPQRAAEIKDAQLSEFATNDRTLQALRDRGTLSTIEARARRTLNLKRALSNPINSMFRQDFINAAKDLTGGGAMDDVLQETPAEKETRLIREKKVEAAAKFEADAQDRAMRTGQTLDVVKREMQAQQADMDKIEKLKAIKAERELNAFETEDLFTTSRSAGGREIASYVKQLNTEQGGLGLDAAGMTGGTRMIESIYQSQLQSLNSLSGIDGSYRDQERERLTKWRDGQLAFLKAHDKATFDKAELEQLDIMAKQIGWENAGPLMAYKAQDPRFVDAWMKSGGNLAGMLNLSLGGNAGTNFEKASRKLSKIGSWVDKGSTEGADDVADFLNTPAGTEYLAKSVEEETDNGLPKVSDKTAGIYAKATEQSLKSFTTGIAIMSSQKNPNYRAEVMKAMDIATDKFGFLNRHQGGNGEISIKTEGTIGRNKRPRLSLNIPDGLQENAEEIKQLYRVIEKQPWVWQHVEDQYVDATDAFNGLMRGEWQPELNTEPGTATKSGARGTRIKAEAPVDKGTPLEAATEAPRKADVAELQELLAAEEAGAPTPEQEARLTELLEQRMAIRDKARTGGKPVDPRPTLPEQPKVEVTGQDTFEQTLKSFENNKNLPPERSGWDGTTWQPHPSIEGGTDTLAYGHKLTAAEAKSGKVQIGGQMVDYRNGITDEQAEDLFQQDLAKHKTVVDKAFPELEGNAHNAITAMVYQGANITKWPNSSKAVKKALKSDDPADWLSAQAHILNSKWATEQTPERALKTVHMMYPDTPIETLRTMLEGFMTKRGVKGA